MEGAPGCGKSGHEAAPLPLPVPAAFSRCFPGKGSQQIRARAELLALAEEGNICLNQLGYSVRRLLLGSQHPERQNRGKTFKKGVLSTPLQFPLGKISKGGEGGKEGRKEIKAHLLPREKEQKTTKISISNGARFLPSAQKEGRGRDEEQLISADRNFLGIISPFSWRSPRSSGLCWDAFRGRWAQELLGSGSKSGTGKPLAPSGHGSGALESGKGGILKAGKGLEARCCTTTLSVLSSSDSRTIPGIRGSPLPIPNVYSPSRDLFKPTSD